MADYSIKTDEQLVKLCRTDNSEAWKELCLRYSKVARSISYKFNADSTEIDDLIQEGLLGFLSAVHSFSEDKGVAFKTYAWICIKNKIINAVKAKGNFMPECQSLDFMGDVADESLTVEERIAFEQFATALALAMKEKLTLKERDVLTLYLEGKSYEEIALSLSISVKSVDGSLQRARKKLKAEIDFQ